MTVTDTANLLLNLLKLLLIILLLAHWSACIFLIAGLYGLDKDDGLSWLQSLKYCSRSEQYVNALYFSVTTMCTIGYGDIRPKSQWEYIIVIVLELVAGILFAYVIGKIGELCSRYNMLAETYRER